MTIDQAIEKILSNTFTKADAYRRFGVLREYVERQVYAHPAAGADAAAALTAEYAQTPEAKTAADIAAWGSETIDFLAASGSGQMQELRSRLSQLPELVLYAPIVLSSAQLSVLSAWCRRDIDPHILLELRTDPESLGGCFFVWKDQYYDFSLSHFMALHEDKLATVIDRYQLPPQPISLPVPTLTLAT